jgi:N,N'-diacetyllegionaminate synthase
MPVIAKPIYINGYKVHPTSKPYCIAEVGINHNGSLKQAIKMIDVAKNSGADAVKFQTFKADEFCGDPNQTFTYQSQGKTVTEPMINMFKRNEMSMSDWFSIKAYCDKIDITFLSTPQNLSDLKLLSKVGISAIKVGSDDLSNTPLLKSFSKFGLPMILSCGMGDLADVHKALDSISWFKKTKVMMMLCTSQYPTPPEDVNLTKIKTLQNAFPGLLVGFSDHTQGSLAASLAVAQGACILEKHFTMDNKLPGPDHWFSDNPAQLKSWVENIKTSHIMLGNPHLIPTKKELKMRTLARRSIVAIATIQLGEQFTSKNIAVRRPGTGLPSEFFSDIIGVRANRKILIGSPITFKELKNEDTR